MSTRRFGGSVHLCAAVAAFSGASLLAIAAAQAGGFAVREQSALYQGMSFAGAGTGDTLSSMYWNSAAAAAAPGFNTETHASVIFADTEMTATGGAFVVPGGLGTDSGNIADPALVPASYANYQLNDQLFLGLAINSGFGLVTKPDNTVWAGSPIAITSDVFSINFNPVVAYKVTDKLTIGIGAQIEYLNVRLNNGPTPAPLPFRPGREVEVDDIGFGATAGLSWTPTAGTTIGIGYRSAVKFDLEGDYNLFGVNTVGAQGDLTLPDVITIGLRQSVTDRLDLLAGYEWTNWSRVGTVTLDLDSGLPISEESLELEYENGHFVSLGAEYAYSPQTLFRAGVAWEKSPVTDEHRNVFLPDADRIWLSVGATHQLTDKITIDLGYSHIFAEDVSICREAPTGGPCTDAILGDELLRADSESSVDIVSASLRYKWGGGEPELEPLK